MPSFATELESAARYLAAHDPILAPIIAAAGPSDLRPHKNYYQELVQSILGQQLSVKAAAAIEARFVALFEGSFPSPGQILSKDVEELRAVGFSRAKANYIQDLARHVQTGQLKFDKLDQQTNAEIITNLTDIKGIGEWTVHMFLIFCMGRLDILPTGDLGIRNGIRKLYGFKDLPTPQQILDIAEKNKWHPYESVGSWYVWHSLDNTPAR